MDILPSLSDIWDSLISGIASIMAALWSWVLGFIGTLLPDWVTTALPSLFEFISGPTTQYLAWLSALDVIIPIVIGAYITRYLLRRVP